MPAFKYWVGNITMGTSGFVREEVHVDASTEDGNNFTKNLVTLRAEMRAAFGVVLPDACVSGNLPAIEELDTPVVVTNTTAKLSGTAEKNSIIVLRENNTAIASTVADGTGAWKFEPNPLGTGDQAVLFAVLGGAVSEAVEVVGT